MRFLLASLPLVLIACSSTLDENIAVPNRAEPDTNTSPAPSSSGDEGSSGEPSTPPAPGDPIDGGADANMKAPKNYAQGPSAGCAKTTGPTGLQTRTKVIGGKTRDYLRFIPAGYQPGTPVAVVFGFHGSGGTAAKARSMFDLESKAGAKAIFIYPQGVPDPAFDGDNRWDPTAGSDDYTFIDELLAETEASHCISRDKVFAVGFSNGARMTSMLGCHRGDRFRAIAPVAPGGNKATLPLAASACAGEVAIWEGVGTEDVDHLEGAALVRDYYRTTNGCMATKTPTTPAGCEAFDGCRAELPSVYCTYPGGHAWPSIGTAAVWSFFSKF
jgi:polyhydroxybutyrate depolymerase